jgi:peptide/nickel transport system substrate-binding protein
MLMSQPHEIPLSRRTLLKATGAAATAAAATPLLRPGRGLAQQAPQKGGTLRYGLSVEPARMNQLNTVWMTDATQHLFDRPLTIDPNGTYTPHLTTWEISDDSLTWTFHIKPGVTFHTGDPFTADALAWWFNKARDQTSGYGFKGNYAAIDKVTVADPATVVLNLSQPDAGLQFILYTVYSSIHNPKTYESLGQDDYGTKTVDGTGPFKLQEYTPGDKLVIVRNDAYAWAPPFAQNQGAPYLDAIQYQYIADATARTTAIQAGDLDIVVQPNLADVATLQQDGNLNVITKPQPACRVVTFNCEKAPWSDKRVRQAFAHAVQRDPIVEKLLFSQGVAAYSLVPPIFPDIFSQDTTSYFPYDIQAGKDLLAAAGLTTGSNGKVQFQGQDWEPEMLVTAETELSQLAQVMQAQAADLGLNIKIVQLDQQTWVSRQLKGDFDIATSFYLWDGPDDMYEWWFLSTNIGTTNGSRFSDPNVDALIKKMNNAGTLADRYAVVKELQQAIHGDLVPLIPVYHPFDIYAISKRVQGYAPNPFTLYPRMHDVWLQQ